MLLWWKGTSHPAFSTISEGSDLISSKTSKGAGGSRAPHSARIFASSRRTLDSLWHSAWPRNSNVSVFGS